MRLILPALSACAIMIAAADPTQAQVVFSAAGPDAASITPATNDFRAALGTLNPNVAGSFDTGRREINWDGVPDALAAPNNLPANFFNVNSPRGVVLGTPGTGFQVSANAGIAPVEFDTINPGYSQDFAAFSAQRIFTALGSNLVDVDFFIPGTTTPAFVTGFGAVFTDVDSVTSTTISFFGAGGALLGSYPVPNTLGNETFSFLGVLFDDPVIARVRITSGSAALGAGVVEGPGVDLVAMDDFIFGEPTLAAAVPEPATWAMLLIGFAAIGLQVRRRGTPRQVQRPFL